MIGNFLNVVALRIGGMALGYGAIVWLNRNSGPQALREYLFLLNSVIVLGTLAALGLPTLVQRLSAQLDGDRIVAETRLALKGRSLPMAAVAGFGAVTLLALEADQPLTPSSAILLTLAALGFALTLVLVETLRITRGPRHSEFQRNIVRPLFTLALLVIGTRAIWAVTLEVLAATATACLFTLASQRRRAEPDPALAGYVAERGRDMSTVFVLGVMELVFGAMDVVLFGFLADQAETGIYGAGSRS